MPEETGLRRSDHWHSHMLDDNQRAEVRRARLRDSAHRIARKLVKAYGARKVFLFGSLKDASLFPEDIDLAVEGLDDEKFYKAVFDVQGLAECRVDILAVEDLSPRFRQFISEKGELLYESH
ncbi:MAG: nucleotidyltransferase family protein [Desulfobacterales bacterium]